MKRFQPVLFSLIIMLLCMVFNCSGNLAKNYVITKEMYDLADDSISKDNVVPPKPILETIVEPKYPEYEKTIHFEGDVCIKFKIDEKGIPSDFSFYRSSSKGCNQAVLDAVKQWRYIPAMKDNIPISVYVAVTVHFKYE